MKVVECREWETVSKVLMNPDILERVVQDTDPQSHKEQEDILEKALTNPSFVPLSVSTDTGILVGIYILMQTVHPEVYEIHINILPEQREEYALGATRSVLFWVKENLSARKLEILVPVKFPRMYKHLMTSGFILRDVLYTGFRQDGRDHSRYYMVLYLGKPKEAT